MIKFLSSYKLMLVLFFLLGLGAAIGTFIENDFGTSSARVLVYNNIWYEVVMTLSIINLILIIYKRKMWKHKARFIFHSAFVVMLIGAGLTRYIGYEGILHIREGELTDKMISMEPYLQITIYDKKDKYHYEYQKEFSAFLKKFANNFDYDIKFGDKKLHIKYKDFIYVKKGKADMSLLQVEIEHDGVKKIIKLPGKRGEKIGSKIVDLKDIKVELEYGSKQIRLPFRVKLDDFVLKRYPGSHTPSSYESFVEVFDKDTHFKYHIFMNHPLTYKNFKLFQSSYDPDEGGSVFSVNNDPGKWPTYIGYILLALGLILNLFDKKSRFYQLSQYIKKTNPTLLVVFMLTILLNSNSFSDEITKYLTSFKKNSIEISSSFSKLITQDTMGRMKPLDTLNLDIVRKLSGKTSMYGLDHNQIVLGMLSKPEVWRFVKLIKIKHPQIKKIFNTKSNYIAFSQAFKDNKYILANLLEKVNQTPPNQRGTLDRALIKLDEKLNIIYMVFYADLFKIIPILNDKNNKWIDPVNAIKTFQGKDKEVVQMLMNGFITNVADSKFDEAKKFLNLLHTYQKSIGKEVYPPQTVIDAEILFNKLNIFPKITIAYVSLGFILFIFALLSVFKPNFNSKKVVNLVFIILLVLFITQTFAMGLRWFISGHAPWSDTYESLVYIAWSAMFAGVLFFRKSLMALSATVVMAGVFMFTAHLSSINPQITNLVPVLKSYWLTIHVSIITGSYGFLAIGAMLGFMSLILFIFRNKNNPQIDKTIKHILSIDEAALIIGLSMITIGNFIGGVWANESWGRYWGWDPKETWAWVSIIVYAFVLHMRFIPKLNKPFYFAVASTLAFGSILMTYFGVNFYLSGLHSYATGDPVPIPTWVYVLCFILFSVISLAYRKKELKGNL